MYRIHYQIQKLNGSIEWKVGMPTTGSLPTAAWHQLVKKIRASSTELVRNERLLAIGYEPFPAVAKPHGMRTRVAQITRISPSVPLARRAELVYQRAS